MSLTEGPPGLPYPKLPLGHAIGLAYSTYFANFASVLRTSWLWLIVIVVPTGLASWQEWSWMSAAIANIKPGQPPALPNFGKMTALLHASQALLLFAGASIAVAWHRLMILNEPPGISGGNVATKTLWRYVGMGIAILAIDILPAEIVSRAEAYIFAGASPTAVSMATTLLIIVLYVFGMAAMLRFGLLLPARAIGNFGLTFAETWHRTSGNTWRLFWGVTATTTPLLMVGSLISIVVTGVPGSASFANLGSSDFVLRITIASTITAMYYLLIVPVGIGFISHAYRHFFEAPLQPTE